MPAITSSSTQHTPIISQSRSRFHSPNTPSHPYLLSPPTIQSSVLSANGGHLHPEDELDYLSEKERRKSVRWALPTPLRNATAGRRRTWLGLGLGAILGLVILLHVLAARTESSAWTNWGLVSDMEGLIGGDYLDFVVWRGIDPARLKDHRAGSSQGTAKTAGKGKGRVKESSQRKGKASSKEKESEVARDDGLYHFNPTELVEGGGPHPITTLIIQAKAAWEEKVSRQSSTLKAAVEEYRKRTVGRRRRGSRSGGHMSNEYDQISRDIHLFHPHRPSTMPARLKKAAQLSDTFRIINTAGVISVKRNFDPAKHPGGEQRIKAQLAMVEGSAAHIGDFEAVWSVHDNGRLFTTWSLRHELEEAVRGGYSLDDEDNEVQDGWSALCPTSSNFPAVLSADSSQKSDTSATSKTFITSLPKSFAICSHPSIVPIHGATSGPYRLPITSGHLPLFSYSRTSAHSDILGIPYSHLINLPPTAWAAKSSTKLLWRGGLTGAHYDERVKWRQTQRFRLLDLATRTDDISLLVPHSSSAKIIPTTYSEAANHYIDVAATGGPIQCDKATCAAIAAGYDFAPRMSHAEAAAYKYVLDVDGNAWSARFKGLLSTGSVVLKSTIMPEWWMDRAQAWVHYVPVHVGYTDLMDIMAYFTGDFSGSGAHDAAGEEIGRAGQEWVKTHWREEDTVAYTFRLYLEWARVWAGGDLKAGYVYDMADEV